MATSNSNDAPSPIGHEWLRRELKLAVPAPAVESYDPRTLSRAVNYLYTKETRSSFAMEGETPNASRTDRFVAALKAAPTFSPDKESLIRFLIVRSRRCASLSICPTDEHLCSCGCVCRMVGASRPASARSFRN